MKQINIYFDFEFTSLSPDAQPISLGIVSQETKPCDFPEMYKGRDLVPWSEYQSKTFYAEFSDFDINRCDKWVKENVVSKLQYDYLDVAYNEVSDEMKGNLSFKRKTATIKKYLRAWLSQFSDYQIQFVCDCGTFDWYWMLQLLAEWKECPCEWTAKFKGGHCLTTINDLDYQKTKHILIREYSSELEYYPSKFIKIGLPKLPENISLVPQDLNDLIALNKGISVREAFDLNREELCINATDTDLCKSLERIDKNSLPEKHNALWDAKVIKAIFEKLK